ncbi:hypothetical protein K9L97_05695 [Candidatus Woesearchaeota archaeon]|nr:hypothetical protein [Candidatus Woesearchaeota archaeon]
MKTRTNLFENKPLRMNPFMIKSANGLTAVLVSSAYPKRTTNYKIPVTFRFFSQTGERFYNTKEKIFCLNGDYDAFVYASNRDEAKRIIEKNEHYSQLYEFHKLLFLKDVGVRNKEKLVKETKTLHKQIINRNNKPYLLSVRYVFMNYALINEPSNNVQETYLYGDLRELENEENWIPYKMIMQTNKEIETIMKNNDGMIAITNDINKRFPEIKEMAKTEFVENLMQYVQRIKQ